MAVLFWHYSHPGSNLLETLSMFLLSDNVNWLNYASAFSTASLSASSGSGSLSARHSGKMPKLLLLTMPELVH